MNDTLQLPIDVLQIRELIRTATRSCWWTGCWNWTRKPSASSRRRT